MHAAEDIPEPVSDSEDISEESAAEPTDGVEPEATEPQVEEPETTPENTSPPEPEPHYQPNVDIIYPQRIHRPANRYE